MSNTKDELSRQTVKGILCVSSQSPHNTFFSTGQQKGLPMGGPFKFTGRPTLLSGRPVLSPCFMGLAAMSWAESGRVETFAKMLGRAGPGRVFLNM